MEDIFIVGAAMTPLGRHMDKSVKQLTQMAVSEALRDAQCPPSAVDVAFFGNTVQGFMEGQLFIRGQIALLPLGLDGVPIHNVENACATGSSAFNLAVGQLQTGSADIALAVGTEKMYSSDKAKMFSIFTSGWDLETVDENFARLTALGEGIEVPPGTTSDKPYSMFMDVYAALARNFMSNYGITQRQIAHVAAKNHTHSVHNELAQYRNPMTTEEVLAAPPITYPFTLPMCAPISDGSAAILLCNRAGLKKLGLTTDRAIRVRASVMRSASAREKHEIEKASTRQLAKRAYEVAGIDPKDVNVAEVHDATAVGELIMMVDMFLFDPDDAGAAVERGETTIGGRLPINPSGGLVSKGHPIGATGLGQIFELVQQLRGECGKRQVEGARIALQENGGGLWGVEGAITHIAILEKAA